MSGEHDDITEALFAIARALEAMAHAMEGIEAALRRDVLLALMVDRQRQDER
jgi:hypothetical protein